MARGGAGRNKRQQGAPAVGQKPAKRSKGGRVADVYEAEDSDPDEEKHKNRYDKVDNYEYEMPSDFEDEEIDEDLAFTEEDKKKYAGWFGDEDGSDEDGSEQEDEGEDDGGSSDLDMRLLDSDEELGKDDGEDEGEGDVTGDAQDDDDPLAALGSDDSGDGFDADEEELGDEEDEEAYASMLAAVAANSKAGQAAHDAGKKGARTRRAAALVDEAYPEAEFGLNPGSASAGAGGDLTLAELMHGLGGEGRRKLPAAARKLLDKMSGGGTKESKAVAAPLPRTIKERVERKAGYETTGKDVAKWQPLVKANREAPTLAFTSARDEVPRVTTTAALVQAHVPEAGGMEAEVAALLAAAGAASAHAVAEAETKLATKELTLEEARERRERLAKLRSLLFYHEIKAKRAKAIKSKEYHRKLAKAEKRKAVRLGDAGAAEAALGDEDAAQAAERTELEDAEFERARERLTLKHRNTSRWARRALKRGATIIDAGTKAAVAEQLALGEALRKRIEGKRTSDSDDEGGSDTGSSSSDMSDGEGGVKPHKPESSKAKLAALEVLTGGDEVEKPKKGLFALPFMARAIERKRVAAQQEATQILQEIEAEEAGDLGFGEGFAPDAALASAGAAASGRLRFGGAGQGQEVMSDSESDGELSDEDEDAEAKAQRLTKRLQGDVAGTSAADAAAQGQAGKVPGGKGQVSRQKPTAEEEADLDAVLAARAGGAGRAGAFSASDLAVPSSTPSGAKRGRAAKAAAVAPEAAGVIALPHAALLDERAASHSHAGPSESQQQPAFMSAKLFAGAKAGYVFKRGPKGVGYYLDKIALQKQAAAITKAASVRIAGSKTAPIANGVATPATGKQQANGKTAAPAAHDSDDDSDGGELRDAGQGQKEGMRAAPASAADRQKALISMAFAGDDVEAEFAADKAAEVAAELPTVEEPSALPGWGAWTAQQKDPKWMRDARARAAKAREAAAAGRKDAGLTHVVLSEKWDKKAMAKYAVQQVPFPFDSKDTYERSIRQPLGKQYNPDSAFRDLTRPAIIKNTGVVINPIRYSKPIGKVAHEVSSNSNKAKVLTVAGGVMKKPKKAK